VNLPRGRIGRAAFGALLLPVGALLLVPAGASAISAGKADKIAMKALDVRHQKGPVTLFRNPNPVPKGAGVVEGGTGPKKPKVTVNADFDITYSATAKVKVLSSPAWLYWLDRGPHADYPHPSVLLLVDAKSGKVVRKEPEAWWPTVNGKPTPFVATAAGYNSDKYRVYSTAGPTGHKSARPTTSGSTDTTALTDAPAEPVASAPDLSHDCVVAMVNQDPKDPAAQGFKGDLQAIRSITGALGLPLKVAEETQGLDEALTDFESATPRCTDAVIWLVGHGSPAKDYGPGNGRPSSQPEVNIGPMTYKYHPPAGRPGEPEGGEMRWTGGAVTGEAIRTVMKKHSAMTFKLIVDSCYSGRWTQLQDVSNLRVIITSSRDDQVSWGYAPNGTYPKVRQQNGQITQPGGTVDVKVKNPDKAGALTNAIVDGLAGWATSDQQQQQTGGDLAKGIALAQKGSGNEDVAQIVGVTDSQIADFTNSRPHGQNPPKLLGFNTLPADSSVIPAFAVAGPTSGDVLVGGENTNKVLAVNGNTGQLDSAVGSSGTLPLPPGLPNGATIGGLTFGGGNIYADFNYFANSTSNIAVVSWNGLGQLNGTFGIGGLVTITGDSTHHWSAGPLALANGSLVLGALFSGSGGGELTPGAVTLIPMNPTSGGLSSSVASEPLPSGIQTIVQNQLLVGPDGNLYDAGAALPNGAAGFVGYLGIFNPSTLSPVGQGTIPDGDNAAASAIAFLNGGLRVGVTTTTNSITSTDLFSGPLGSTTGLQSTRVPLVLSGSDQSPSGLLALGGNLVAGVADAAPNIFQTFLIPSSNSSFGAPVQVGDSGSQGFVTLPFGSGGIEVGVEWSGQNFNTYQTFFAPFSD
jgi:hypothetical protein